MELTFERSSIIRAPVDALRQWHFQPDAFEKLTPPWEQAKVVEAPSELTDGARAVIEIRMGPFKKRWVAEHEITPDGFIDRQIEGPFAFWEHRHQFLPIDASSSRLVDSIRYRLPFGTVGRIFGAPIARAKLNRLFRYRHQVTGDALDASGQSPSGSAAS